MYTHMYVYIHRHVLQCREQCKIKTQLALHSPQKEQGLEYAWNTVAIILFQALLGLQTQEALGPP